WPTLLAFVFAARALHGPLNSLASTSMMLATHAASAERISEFLDTASDVREAAEPLHMPGMPRQITATGVGFGYEGPNRPVLQGISFTLEAGETLGIVGPSGAGKSTLLGLVARFFDPSQGCLAIDGTDMRRIRLSDLYGRMAIVTQEPFLFATSIRENIRCGRPDATDAEVEEAA